MFKIRETPEISSNTNELFSLKNKVCVITGGSSGIGLEIVKAFASLGGDVIIIYNSTPVDSLIEEIKQKFKVNVDHFKCNLSNVEEIEDLFTKIVNKYQKIDVLVANAGIGWPDKGINDFKSHEELVEKWEKFIKLDLSSVYYCCAFIGRIFEKQGYGSLILTASISGSVVNIPQLQTPYNVAKAGIKQMAKSLAIEWSSIGNGKIRVNSVSPGYVKTNLVKKMDPTLIEKWCKMIPLGRMASSKELTGAYVYLASDASSYTTGTDIVVDGGYCSV
jgi:sorbose reductase